MGNENSANPKTTTPVKKGKENTSGGIVIPPELNYSRPDLVLVSAGPNDSVTSVNQAKEEELDIILQELENIPSFLPLIKSTVKGWEKYPAQPFPLEPLPFRSSLELCRSYQDFLRKATSIAGQEQKLIGNNIKKLELITSRTLEYMGGKASEMKRFELRFRDVGTIAKQLNDVKMKIEGVVDSMQRLNMLLPPTSQLEKLSFNGKKEIESENHEHSEQCAKTGITKPVSGVCSLQGRRPTMEDTHVSIDCLHHVYPQLSEFYEEHMAFYAVFDGHGGVDTALLAEKILLDSLVESTEFQTKNVQQAFEDAYQYTDKVILQKSQQEKWRNGSTAVTTLIIGNTLYSANAGDSEAVLGRRISKDVTNLEYEPLLLTKKHNPTDPSERVRIERAGGSVFHGRVLGSLAVSRAFGDLDFKEIPMVIPTPYITKVDVQEEDEFLIVACDGLWDVMKYEEAVSYVAERRQIDNLVSSKELSKELCNDAIKKRGSSDNVSVVVVFLKAPFS